MMDVVYVKFIIKASVLVKTCKKNDYRCQWYIIKEALH